MKRILFILAVCMMAVNVNAQDAWSRKYATTVLRGHVSNLPEDYENVLTRVFCMPRDLVKNERDPLQVTDSAGYFCIKCKICWPFDLTAELCKVKGKRSYYLCPEIPLTSRWTIRRLRNMAMTQRVC